jgi:hypothetical protein
MCLIAEFKNDFSIFVFLNLSFNINGQFSFPVTIVVFYYIVGHILEIIYISDEQSVK